MIKPPLEREITRSILDLLKFHEILAWRNNSGMFRIQGSDGGVRFMHNGLRGTSDIIGMTNDGKFLAIEVKRPGGKTTPEQDTFLSKVRTNGGVSFVAYSIDDVKRELDLKPVDNWIDS